MSSAARSIEVAEAVATALEREGAKVAVIGAVALAAHGYIRRTKDFDLGTSTDPFSVLRRVKDELITQGFEVELREPDAEDPLGGLLVVRARGSKPVEVVNFLNPYSPSRGRVGIDAVKTAMPMQQGGLPIVDLPHLVALKLYAGGRKNELDVLEVLERNPQADRSVIGDLCVKFRLGEDWKRILSAISSPKD